jgi:hypothetical protein
VLDKNININEMVNKNQKIPEEEILILYSNEIYDGPIEGLCEYNKNKYYFLTIEGNSLNKKRPFLLIQLSKEQLDNEELLHSKYLEYIENHEYTTESSVSYRKGAEWDKYHKTCDKFSDQIIKKDQIIGWFEK